MCISVTIYSEYQSRQSPTTGPSLGVRNINRVALTNLFTSVKPCPGWFTSGVFRA